MGAATEQSAAFADVLARLQRRDRLLHLSACLVQSLHPEAARIADEIVRFVQHRYAGVDVIDRYAARVAQLNALQQAFDRDRRVQNLGDPAAAVARDDYNLSLLLSIALTNHRFEIMRELAAFAERIAPGAERIVSIGAGTGFELRELALRAPASARIEAYDIDAGVQEEARRFLAYFGVTRKVEWPRRFPLDAVTPAYAGALDAVVLCEVLEHLDDPLQALKTLRDCLKPDGLMFATMAINIAQEDHIFLYGDIAACRDQLGEAGLAVVSERVTPMTIWPPADDRETGFSKGNYVAVVRKA